MTGLRTKTQELYVSAAGSGYDIVCLTETWLCAGFNDAELFDSDYQVFRRDRHLDALQAPVGGGVLCAVKRSLPCSLVEIPDTHDLEIICVVLTLADRKLYIATVYIPPSAPALAYETVCNAIDHLSNLLQPSDDIIVFGDFNLPQVSWHFSDNDDCLAPSCSSSAQHVTNFLDSMHSAGLVQLSAVTNSSGKNLDLVFASNPNETSISRCSSPLVAESTHHPALHAIVNFFSHSVPSNLGFCNQFNFKQADFSILSSEISNCDWSCVLDEPNLDLATHNFYGTLFGCFARCVPISSSPPVKRVPWLTADLINLRNRKTKAWKAYSGSRCQSDYLLFSELNSLFMEGSRHAYSQYVHKTKNFLRDKPKQFWSFINSKRYSDGYPASLSFGVESSEDPSVISNYFGDHFRSAFSVDGGDDGSNRFGGLSRMAPTTLQMKDLTIDEDTILKYISNISDSFGGGPDGLPASVLKKCGSSMVSVLCYLFNTSLRSGIFPVLWKYSTIIPLHKKGKRDDVKNYRPIANLPSVAKLFESVVCDVLHFHCKSVISAFQHGFTKGRSTTTNLVEFSSFTVAAIEAGKQVDCVYTDFSKAFDKISHNILTNKLLALGFPVMFVNWIRSYLTGRFQRVLFRGALSSIIPNSSGVPQGSHLGPLLFILYINDLGLAISNSRILIYADDAKIFRVVENDTDCSLLQSDLTRFHDWCTQNHMPLNVSKCTTVSFSRKKTPVMFDYVIDGCSLAKLDKVRDLGVIFNSAFTFDDHIENIVNKANSVLGFVRRWCKEFKDPHITKTLYCALVRSILEYACPVWAPFYSVHINRLESVQRRFLRFALYHLPWSDPIRLPPYADRLKLLNLETLEERRCNSRIVFAFKILSGSVDSPHLLNALQINAPSRSFRKYELFKIARHRTNYGMNEPIAAMSRCFNSKYDLIDFNVNLTTLKNQLV